MVDARENDSDARAFIDAREFDATTRQEGIDAHGHSICTFLLRLNVDCVIIKTSHE